jgi:hypothetical protein
VLVAASVLPVTRSALNERRLVGTDASDLSALAGARGGGGRRHPANAETEIKLLPLENGASRGAMAYLKVEKPRFLFLKGSTGAVAAADVATVTLPDASATRAGTSAVRAASFVDRLAAGTPAPALGTRSSAASAALGDGGAGSHLSGGPPVDGENPST